MYPTFWYHFYITDVPQFSMFFAFCTPLWEQSSKSVFFKTYLFHTSNIYTSHYEYLIHSWTISIIISIINLLFLVPILHLWWFIFICLATSQTFQAVKILRNLENIPSIFRKCICFWSIVWENYDNIRFPESILARLIFSPQPFQIILLSLFLSLMTDPDE